MNIASVFCWLSKLFNLPQSFQSIQNSPLSLVCRWISWWKTSCWTMWFLSSAKRREGQEHTSKTLSMQQWSCCMCGGPCISLCHIQSSLVSVLLSARQTSPKTSSCPTGRNSSSHSHVWKGRFILYGWRCMYQIQIYLWAPAVAQSARALTDTPDTQVQFRPEFISQSYSVSVSLSHYFSVSSQTVLSRRNKERPKSWMWSNGLHQ